MNPSPLAEGAPARSHTRWHPVPHADVTIEDAFWTPRITLNRERSIPFQYEQLQKTGRIEALRLAWSTGQEPVPHIFWDSDVAKWIEAASYSLATHPDPALDVLVDDAIALLAAAQQPDGYLNTYFTVVEPGQRWTDLRDAHELYCAGHLIEAGVAHVRATGKRTLLDVVCRYADHIDTVFGTTAGKKRGYCGHEEIELALVKLYRATGEERYLSLALYFVDERGRQPYYFDLESAERGRPGYFENHYKRVGLRTLREYNQSHKPVREQDEVVGHAVRAMYLYSAMADLAAETGDAALRQACSKLWDHLNATRLYITGGIGSAAENEGFTADFDLPNETAYAETCAAIGLVFWAHRMAHLEGHARYIDVLERALYNAVLGGVSYDGTRFFYANPLASRGNITRQEWFGVACCPPNLARLLASLGQYIYSASASDAAVHLFVGSNVRLTLDGARVELRQRTDYPWDGAVTLTVSLDRPARFGLNLRLPEWCRTAALRVNDTEIDCSQLIDKGYIRVEREWSDGDTVQLDLAMPVERIYANPAVAADAGCVALQRGPLVYCAEGVDNTMPLHQMALPRNTPLAVQREPDLLGGVTVIAGPVRGADHAAWDGTLYKPQPPAQQPGELAAVPFFAWDNRGPGPMRVWLREALDRCDE